MSRQFTINCGCPEAVCSLELTESLDMIDLYRFSVTFPAVQKPVPVTVEWEEDMVNILHTWHPNGRDHRGIHQWFGPTTCVSRFCCGAPVLCTIGSGGLNSETVAVSDATTPINLRFYVKDLQQEDKVGYSIEFFSLDCDPLQTYTAQIRIDRRQIPYYESIPAVTRWWADCGYSFPACPAAAEDPLYSSWYNFHQAPEAAPLLKDLEIAAKLGFRTVILDDGWQFDGPSTGHYSSCGEWAVAESKFPDFKQFADEVHRLGMKLMVWFSVPFIGDESPVFSRFEGKYLYYSESLRSYTLDPRYSEVRAFLIDIYADFLRKYDVDGFKLDFIDSFRIDAQSPAYNVQMDCTTVDQGVQVLMQEIVSRLGAIKPELLYEYRQNYVGPAINRFGNMLRVADCAYDAQINRVGIVDLRLLDYPIAVHSDMLLWSRQEQLSLCARQLLNILFSVPQISVILADSTPEQTALLENFIGYWTKNREVLLHGSFRPLHPELNYPFISSESEGKRIAVQYAPMPYTDDGKDCDLFVCTGEGGLLLENPTGNAFSVSLRDCVGTVTEEVTVQPGSIVRLNVPPYGMARILH